MGSGAAIKKKEFYDRDTEPKLIVLHTTHSRFQCVVIYNNYRVLERVQIFNRKVAEKTGKYVKFMDTMAKAFKIDNNYLIIVLRFMTEFTGACDSNGILESMALCIVSNFMKDELASRLKIRLTLMKIPHAKSSPQSWKKADHDIC